MQERKYIWKFDRVTALLVAMTNCIVASYIVFLLIFDEYFLRNQFGINGLVPSGYKISIGLIILVLYGYMNVQFLKKQHGYRVGIALIQTVALSFILRNLFVGVMYNGLLINSYWVNILGFVIIATTIYHTLFSTQIHDYFNVRKKTSGGIIEED